MTKKEQARRWWQSLSAEEQAAYVSRIVAKRAADPRRQLKVDVQAWLLIAERIALFGPRWRENCAIRVPQDFVDPYADGGDASRYLETEMPDEY